MDGRGHPSSSCDAPDVTDDVMRRLGFVRVPLRDLRRRRTHRILMRVLGVGALLFLFLVADGGRRSSLDGAGFGRTSIGEEGMVAGQARLFSGLAAPLDRLEQLLDHNRGGPGDGDSEADLIDSITFHGPISEEVMRPLLELEKVAITPFPSS
jgi:hypothetical protein